jgi:chorismate mutase/prephenate dehydratase
MSDGKTTLDGLREEIDGIDDAIHDLLMRRAALAEQIGQAKLAGPPPAAASAPVANREGPGVAQSPAVQQPAVYLRPGREALVLRRLVRRHEGSFPVQSLVRLWREIMSSLLRLQGPFSVAVLTGGEDTPPGLWDLARDYYGATTPMIACQGASQVMREVSEGRATVGVLPVPEQGENAPWWPMLIGAGPDAPRVFARLPFYEPAVDRGALGAVAIARVAPEATGEDRSLLAIETAEDLSRTRLTSALSAAGLPLVVIVDEGRSGAGRYLAEIDGFVEASDGRLAQLSAALGASLSRLAILGAYAATLTDEEAAPRKSVGIRQ